MKKIQTLQSLLQKHVASQVFIEKVFELVKCKRLFASFKKKNDWLHLHNIIVRMIADYM